ncbi:MAG: maleylpyruvate isomerase N-terminal domain-containing protein, partial [Chloroflexota bacterium]
MNKTEFLNRMQTERAGWNALLAQAGEARMTQPGCAGHWSLKDIVAHVTAYEQWLVTWLAAAARGLLTPPSVLNDSDIDRRNGVVYEQNKDRPLPDVLADAERVFQQLVAAVQALPDGDLVNEKRTAWFVEPFWKESVPLWEAIAGDSY